jgi:predicted transcriptional regulator
VSIRLDPKVVRRLDRLATARGTTRASVLRDVLTESIPDYGVDRTQIKRMLRLTPAERVRDMADTANTMLQLQGLAHRRR